MNVLRFFKNLILFTTGIALFGVLGCAETGDFGRRKPGLVTNLSTVDVMPSRLNSPSSLTEDERELRNRVFALVRMPRPLPTGPLLALPDELDRAIGPDPDFYYLSIAGAADRSPTARYRRLQADIASDRVLIPRFRQIACRVEQMDKVRSDVSTTAPALSENDRNDARSRIDENLDLIRDVESAIPRRFDAYHAALEHLAAASPDAMARQTLASLDVLIDETASAPCGQAPRAHIIRKG